MRLPWIRTRMPYSVLLTFAVGFICSICLRFRDVTKTPGNRPDIVSVLNTDDIKSNGNRRNSAPFLPPASAYLGSPAHGDAPRSAVLEEHTRLSDLNSDNQRKAARAPMRVASTRDLIRGWKREAMPPHSQLGIAGTAKSGVHHRSDKLNGRLGADHKWKRQAGATVPDDDDHRERPFTTARSPPRERGRKSKLSRVRVQTMMEVKQIQYGKQHIGKAWSNTTTNLPGIEDAKSLLRRLEASQCEANEALPFTRLAVMGLPNTGTNALQQFLHSKLGVPVDNGPEGVWKHITHFHPVMERKMTPTCNMPLSNISSEQRVGFIITVRHPITWLLSQTSKGASFGTFCRPQDEICVFPTCGEGKPGPGCELPHLYRFKTLLDLWAAHALHLPTGLQNILVIRYEDFIRDVDAVLQKVSTYFNVTVDMSKSKGQNNDPLRQNSRSRFIPWSKIRSTEDARERWEAFEDFWDAYGLNSGSIAEIKGERLKSVVIAARLNGESSASQQISCKAVQNHPGHIILSPDNIEMLKLIMRNSLETFRTATNAQLYRVPSVSHAEDAWSRCGKIELQMTADSSP